MRINKTNLRNICVISIMTIAMMAISSHVMRANNLFFNTSPSHVPIGIWQKIYNIDETNKPLQPGDIILFSLTTFYKKAPEMTDQNMLPYDQLLKTVSAVAGDRITSRDNRVVINEQLYVNATIIPKYASGDIRCKIKYPLIVSPDYVWLMADNQNSFDSRYFGAVPISLIECRAKGILLWK